MPTDFTGVEESTRPSEDSPQAGTDPMSFVDVSHKYAVFDSSRNVVPSPTVLLNSIVRTTIQTGVKNGLEYRDHG